MKLFTNADLRTTNADALSRIGSVGRVKERTNIPDENTKKKKKHTHTFCTSFMIPP